MTMFATIGVALLAAPSAAGAPADPACAGVRPALPATLAGWTTPRAVTAGTRPMDGATLPLGVAATVALHPARHLAFATAARDGNGGTLSFAAERGGVYRVVAGTKVWIDIVADGAPVASIAHAHGPACTGIRKMVDFRLPPGRHMLQLSGSAAQDAALMVVRIG